MRRRIGPFAFPARPTSRCSGLRTGFRAPGKKHSANAAYSHCSPRAMGLYTRSTATLATAAPTGPESSSAW
ncbi:protein of unknown function [Azospirillum baldaniorum]|uniref:Uncharacterized protein n=1 Tax=Azospirillum baldaniorum TaxID=1064539 RepID=A0A9P1NN90_9PROT|nr:protein of unknown function [Azospirillum baldaniorum]